METRERNDFCIRSEVRARIVENTHSERRNHTIVTHTSAICLGETFRNLRCDCQNILHCRFGVIKRGTKCAM